MDLSKQSKDLSPLLSYAVCNISPQQSATFRGFKRRPRAE
ncbi:hypothetical protein CCACVL1_03153 [Corchorus capsularis]|uniref:Uncharacterized protein n=1 Tax=Corchorus capsularis TaxID=210143 RepID=A0A1R3K235_COCAP|nr:hypothetical protein CCACVL1_03153 [Corchorus capsularis]